MPATTLARYYRALDAGHIDAALAMLDEALDFAMVLPAGVRRGHSRADMDAYLGGRGVADRVHVVLRETREQDLEFVYGKVADGGTTTGRFLSGARIGADGMIASYQVTFDTEHVLVADA